MSLFTCPETLKSKFWCAEMTTISIPFCCTAALPNTAPSKGNAKTFQSYLATMIAQAPVNVKMPGHRNGGVGKFLHNFLKQPASLSSLPGKA